MRRNRFWNVAEAVSLFASLLNRVFADVLAGFIAGELGALREDISRPLVSRTPVPARTLDASGQK